MIILIHYNSFLIKNKNIINEIETNYDKWFDIFENYDFLFLSYNYIILN